MRMLTIIGPACLALARNQFSGQNTWPHSPPTPYSISCVRWNKRSVSVFERRSSSEHHDVISLGYGLRCTNHLVVTFWEPLLLGKSIQVVLFGSEVCLEFIIRFLLQSGTRRLFFSRKTLKHNICPIETNILDHALWAKNIRIVTPTLWRAPSLTAPLGTGTYRKPPTNLWHIAFWILWLQKLVVL